MSEHLQDNYIQYALSTQEKEVAKQLAHLLTSDRGIFEIKKVRNKVKIEQHSHLSAIITRLVQKGLLSRVKRGQYCFKGVNLVRCLKSLR